MNLNDVQTLTEMHLEAHGLTAKGWTFDTLQFAMRDSSRRPSMAFAMFTKPTGPDDG